MNANQVQVRLIKVSGSCPYAVSWMLHCIFLLKNVGAFYSDVSLNLLNGARRNSPSSLLLLAANLKKRDNSSFLEILSIF